MFLFLDCIELILICNCTVYFCFHVCEALCELVFEKCSINNVYYIHTYILLYITVTAFVTNLI